MSDNNNKPNVQPLPNHSSKINHSLPDPQALSDPQRNLLRRLGRIGVISLVLAIISGLSSLLSILQLVANFNPSSVIYLALALIALVVFGLNYFLVRSGEAQISRGQTASKQADNFDKLLARWERRAAILASLLIALALVAQAVIQLFVASTESLTAGFLLLPVITPLLGLNRRYVSVIATLAGLTLAVTYLASNLWLTPGPGTGASVITANSGNSGGLVVRLATWVLYYAAVAGCVIAFSFRMDKALEQEEEQTRRIQDLLNQREATTQFGAELSAELSGVVIELEGAANQQAVSTQEQVATVTQTTSSLEELGETASQIAANAQKVVAASIQLVEIAEQVVAGGEGARQIAAQGQGAVEETAQSVGQVRNRIEQLGQRLLALTEQMKKVSSAINLINEIADETHLLALNASIEAAGSIGIGSEVAPAGGDGSGLTNNYRGQVGGDSSLRGERFGVIAMEIKNLADRSREATEEVRQVISEMQGAVAAAVLVAEEGKKATAAALGRSEIAGAVIRRLNEAVGIGVEQFGRVLEVAEQVRSRSEEISLATNQQRTANSQVVQSMRLVSDVARQGAGAVVQIAQAVGRVSERVVELNGVLQTN